MTGQRKMSLARQQIWANVSRARQFANTGAQAIIRWLRRTAAEGTGCAAHLLGVINLRSPCLSLRQKLVGSLADTRNNSRTHTSKRNGVRGFGLRGMSLPPVQRDRAEQLPLGGATGYKRSVFLLQGSLICAVPYLNQLHFHLLPVSQPEVSESSLRPLCSPGAYSRKIGLYPHRDNIYSALRANFSDSISDCSAFAPLFSLLIY